jgi:lysophospholipase L1-like esterase
MRPILKSIALLAMALGISGCNGSGGAAPVSYFLVGDSISLGYLPYVQDLLPRTSHNGTCPYFQDDETGDTNNGGSSRRDAACIALWLNGTNHTVVHFNAGLHDVHDCFGRHQVELSDYLENLQTVLDAIRANGAIPVFATTTPVEGDIYCHSDSDIRTYNAAAVSLMHGQGVLIDDLYDYMLPEQDKYHLPGNIHFTQEGNAYLGMEVAACLQIAVGDAPESEFCHH